MPACSLGLIKLTSPGGCSLQWGKQQKPGQGTQEPDPHDSHYSTCKHFAQPPSLTASQAAKDSAKKTCLSSSWFWSMIEQPGGLGHRRQRKANPSQLLTPETQPENDNSPGNVANLRWKKRSLCLLRKGSWPWAVPSLRGFAGFRPSLAQSRAGRSGWASCEPKYGGAYSTRSKKPMGARLSPVS